MPLLAEGSSGEGGNVSHSTSLKDSAKGPRVSKRAVIDENLIVAAIKQEQEFEEDALPGYDRTIDLRTVTNLVMSFQNILKIENLCGFEQLTKLQLDNNVIEKIENLDSLTNLQWLDLSFNNIKKIEGLEELTQITDLSLFDNQIESVEGLEHLENLEVLSLGNNQIKDLEAVKSLRRFKKLRVLNLKGCPVAEEEDYEAVAFAHIPSLKYLDYQRIEPEQVQKARDRLLDQLVQIEEREKVEEAERIEREKEKKIDEKFEAANLGGMRTFFDSILRGDSEFGRLQMLPGYGKIIEEYRVMFERCCSTLVEKVMTTYQEKVQEESEFRTAFDSAKEKRDAISVEKIQTFDSVKKRALKLYIESFSTGTPEPAILQNLKEKVEELSDELMENEMLLVCMWGVMGSVTSVIRLGCRAVAVVVSPLCSFLSPLLVSVCVCVCVCVRLSLFSFPFTILNLFASLCISLRPLVLSLSLSISDIAPSPHLLLSFSTTPD